MNTLLVLLHPSDAPPSALRLGADGGILARDSLAAETAAPRPARTVVAVPGSEVRVFRLELPARNPVQAGAAARLLLQDRIASPVDDLHLALADSGEPGIKLVAAVSRQTMAQWLARCAALGLEPDALVPDHLLLPPPEDGGVRVAALHGRVLVRGQDLAISAEPELAAMAVDGELPPAMAPAAAEAMFARQAVAPPLDLLQGSFARNRGKGARTHGRRPWILAALLLLSPVLLLAADALRHSIGAQMLDARAEAAARAALHGAADAADPVGELRRQYEARTLPAVLSDRAGMLLAEMSAAPELRLDSLEFDPARGLEAGILHPDAATLDALAARLQAQGLMLTVLDSQPAGQRLRSQARIEGAAR